MYLFVKFKPVLVPPHESSMNQDEDSYSDVDDYFAEISDKDEELSDLQMKNNLPSNLTCSTTIHK